MKTKEDRVIRKYNNTTIGGVCGAMSEYFGINITFLRLIWFISIFCYGIGILLYILCWIILPNDSNY